VTQDPGSRSGSGLEPLVSRQLDRAVFPPARDMADRLAARLGVAAVLFYGKRLRSPDAEGLLDFYVLTDRDSAWRGPGLGALGNRLLPPNVYYVEMAGSTVAAKVAVMRLAAFRARMRQHSWDTTLWARFAQPVALLYARDDATRREVHDAIASARRTAAYWADRLSDGGDRWGTLFAATYGAELRVEGTDRARSVSAADPGFYAEIDEALPPVHPDLGDLANARRAWRRRQAVGRALNVLRLTKAAATYRGGMAYALSKIERHAGAEALSAWERRFPWIAAPVVIARLLRRGRTR